MSCRKSRRNPGGHKYNTFTSMGNLSIFFINVVVTALQISLRTLYPLQSVVLLIIKLWNKYCISWQYIERYVTFEIIIYLVNQASNEYYFSFTNYYDN